MTGEHSQVIKPDEMLAAIESSGYLIEARIARVLAEKGFFVQPNAFQTDPNDPEKTIETDVMGRRAELVNQDNNGSVIASVLVECKNNLQPFVFFAQKQMFVELNENRIQYGGFPSYSLDLQTNVQVPLHKLLMMKDWHHYCAAKEVATQFCSFSRAGKQWKAEPSANYAKSFSNLAVAAVRDKEGGFGLHLQNIQVQITYPVIVFQGPIYRAMEAEGKTILEEAQHIQLHHFALLGGELLPVQIDVVTEAEFPTLVETIKAELKTFRDRVIRFYTRLHTSALDQKRLASRNPSRR